MNFNDKNKLYNTYPVISSSPGLKLIYSNTRFSDWVMGGMIMASPLVIPLFNANPRRTIIPTSMYIATAVFAVWMIGGRSFNRLIGRHPNEDEVSKYKYRPDFKHYQVRIEPFREQVFEGETADAIRYRL